MAVSEKKKISNAKWDKANMTVLACKVRKDTADRFKELCAEANTTPNAVLQQAVKDFIEAEPAGNTIQKENKEL